MILWDKIEYVFLFCMFINIIVLLSIQKLMNYSELCKKSTTSKYCN